MALFTNIDSQAGQPKYISVGQILALNISGTTTGYVDGASLTIGAPAGGGVQAVGTIKVTGGAITGVTMTNPGAGYTSAPTVTAPTGSGATITATVAPNDVPNSQIVFVSYEESQILANQIKGLTTPGWYRVIEKLSADGQTTFKSECLVAMSVMSATSGDAKLDDAIVGDVAITITSQPAEASVTAPAAASFVVAGTGITTYQWQVQTAGTGAYANLTAAGVYVGGVTAATLNITNSTGLNLNRYRVVCGNGGTAVVTSRGARLNVA